MSWFSSIIDYINHLGLVGSFLVMIVENLGIPFPTEAGFLVAQNLVVTERTSFWVADGVLVLGNVVGSLISYTIGRWGDKTTKTRFSHWTRVQKTREHLQQWYKRYGHITIFLTRNFGYVRPWSSFVAGFANVPLGPFVFWTTLGSLVFCTVVLLITDRVIAVWHHYPALHPWLIGLAVLLFFGLAIFELMRGIYDRLRRK